MRLNIGLLAIMLELGVLSCSPALAQFPAQRFGKVTAAQLETTTLTLKNGAASGKVMTSDASGNGSWQSPAGPVDVGWRATSDGNNISSLYRQVVVGGPAVGAERLLVQGFLGWGYGADLTNSDVAASYASSAIASKAFDNSLGDVWMPTDPAPWVALKFNSGPKQVSRVTLYKYRDDAGQGIVRFPWDQFTVYGSSNSTNGADGTWTAISPVFTIQHLSESSHSYDFQENAQAFSWLKLAGTRSTQAGNLWLHEVEAFTYAPAPAKRFWVDAQGNPGSDGRLTAAALELTTNALTQSITQQDVRNWNTNLAAWTPLEDGAALTAKQARVALGATAIGPERLLVQGFLPTSAYNPFSERALSSYDDRVYVFTSSNWYTSKPWPVFDGLTTGEWWRPSTGAQWIAYKNPSGLARAVNRVSFYQEGFWVPLDTFQVLGSNDSTNGADGTWTLLGGPFLARNGSGWEHYDLPGNTAAFKWHKLSGSVADLSSRLTYEIRFSTYSPALDKKFFVDARGNPATDGAMTAGSYRFTPLSAAPDSPTTGTAYFDSPTRKLRVWDGSAWQSAW